jgi:hypothetical protein
LPSIIKGKLTQSSTGAYHRGVAPNSTLLAHGINYASNDLATAILLAQVLTLFEQKNANIINISQRFETDATDLTYNPMIDAMVDSFVRNSSVVVVVADGNSGGPNGGNYDPYPRLGAVGSPGKAMNAVTVGNCSNTSNNGYYELHWSSSSDHDWSIPNKPDISAPGAGISCLVNNQPYYGSTSGGAGTSGSAAIVSGVIALMMQADPTLIGKPSKVKAVLIACATRADLLPDVGFSVSLKNLPKYNVSEFFPTPAQTKLMGNRTGTGLLKASSIVLPANNKCDAYAYRASNGVMVSGQMSVYLNAGQTVRVVLTTLKANDSTVTMSSNNFKLELRTGQNLSLVASCTSPVNNVQIIEYTVPQGASGYYLIRPSTIALDSTMNGSTSDKYLLAGISYTVLN